MSTDRFSACLDVVLSLEPDTDTSHLGFTQESWQQWVGANHPVTTADVMKLTRSDVELPYGAVFWRGCNARYLPAGVDLCVFDECVNEGVPAGNAALHRALEIAEPTEVSPRVVGPVTLKAAALLSPGPLIDRLCDNRLARRGPEWRDRVETIRKAAKAMAAEASRSEAA